MDKKAHISPEALETVAKLTSPGVPQSTRIHKYLMELYKLMALGTRGFEGDIKRSIVADTLKEIADCVMGIIVSYDEQDLETKLQGISELRAHVQGVQSRIMLMKECGYLNNSNELWFGSMEYISKMLIDIECWSKKTQNLIKDSNSNK